MTGIWLAALHVVVHVVIYITTIKNTYKYSVNNNTFFPIMPAELGGARR